MALAVGLVTLWALSVVPGLARALVARLGGMEVARLMLGFGPRLAAWRVGATTLQLHAIPLGAFSQIVGLHAVDRPVAASDGRAFAARPPAARLAVLAAGAGGYLALALLVSVAANLTLGVPTDGDGAVVDGLRPGKPAALAGLEVDDEIVAIGGHRVDSVAAVLPLVDSSAGPVAFELRRHGQTRVVTVTAIVDDGHRRIGITLRPGVAVVRVPVGRAIRDGVTMPFAQLAYAFASVRQPGGELSGPIGIVRDMRHVALTLRYAAAVVSLAAMQLFAMLLLPLPFFDGGRVVARLWRRRRAGRPAAVDAGLVARGRAPLGAAGTALFVLATLCAVVVSTSVLLHGARGVPIAVACAVGLGGLVTRRAWGWSAVAAAAPFLVFVLLLTTPRGFFASSAVVAAFLGAIALLPWTRRVRAAFGLECPVCHAVDGRPVLGAPRHFGCLGCGSTWRT